MLYTLFDVPGVGRKALRDLSLKDIYNVFVENKKPVIASKSYWEHRLRDNDINWNMWFTHKFNNEFIPRKCKDFNWKLFYNQLNTESRLQKMKYSDGLCKICTGNIENAEHMLIRCDSLNTIWNETVCVIRNYIDSSYVITNEHKIAGYFENNVGTHFINVLLTITRWAIWKRRNNIKYDAMITSVEKGLSKLRVELITRMENLSRSDKLKKTC